MDQLQQARAQIDEIDAKMAALFEQRMQAVGQVAQYKARTGKQVFDPAREALVLEKNTARVQNPELQPYYREFLKKALAVSRAYQHVLIGQDVAAYQGVEGAWSHIALRQLIKCKINRFRVIILNFNAEPRALRLAHMQPVSYTHLTLPTT